MTAHNATGLLPSLRASSQNTMTLPITIALASVLAYFILHALNPRLDKKEPPLLRARVPLIGHIISMMRHQANFHVQLARSTRKPIATLPMPTGKMYAVWDPSLVAAGLKNKTLSTTPTMLEMTPVLAQVSRHTTDLLHGPRGPHIVDRIMLHAIPTALKGANMARLNETALAELATAMTSLTSPTSPKKPASPTPGSGSGTSSPQQPQPPSTGPAHNPFSPSSSIATGADIEQALWTLEENILPLTLNLPRLFVRAGHRARQTLFDALTPYYTSKRDLDSVTSGFVRHRAAELRDQGMPDADIARVEMMLPFAAVANTVPTLFWLFCFCFSGGEGLVGRLRAEVEGLITADKRGEDAEVRLVVSMAAVEERCPLLMSCYKETLRMAVHQVSSRTAVEDTVLRDGGGREYLLKKGIMTQLVIGVGHELEDYWGRDTGFDPERFLGRKGEESVDGPGSSKAIRAAYQPFGGGVHRCPGERFAFAEMISVMATLLLAFDVQPLEGAEWKIPAFGTPSVIDAVTKPARHGQGFGVRLKVKPGWEGVRWRYEM